MCLFALDKERPAVVLSTDALNRFSLDVCVIPISSVQYKQFLLRPKLPTGMAGLQRGSWAKCDQVTTLEKQLAVYPPLGSISGTAMTTLEEAVRVALELHIP